jgi:glycosyltransferase involved in cell wall biosynthesis
VDHTEAICLEYDPKDSRVRYHRNERNQRYAGNQNAAYSWNRYGTKEMRGIGRSVRYISSLSCRCGRVAAFALRCGLHFRAHFQCAPREKGHANNIGVNWRIYDECEFTPPIFVALKRFRT